MGYRDFFRAPLFRPAFFAVLLRPPFFAVLFRPPFLALLFRGTFAPFFRASDNPIAIACLRLFTFPPLPPLPLFSVPRLRRFMALSTVLLAAFPYFRPLRFLAAICILLGGSWD